MRYRAVILFFVLLLPFLAWGGDNFYLNCDAIRPGQHRYTSAVVQDKIAEALKQGQVHWSVEQQKFVLSYDEGLSILPLERALPVVQSQVGYVLVDGHHAFLVSQAYGATTVPVKVIADYSDVDPTELWLRLEAQGWIYPVTLDGEAAELPIDFCQLSDDPNRFLAARLACRIDEDRDFAKARGAEYPVWIKVGKDQPYIEFRIADALWQHGVVYDNAMGWSPPKEVVEAARAALLKAEIQGLWVVPERISLEQLKG